MLFLSDNLKGQSIAPSAGEIPLDSKFYIGGGLGLSFGTNSSVYLAPELSYALTNKLYFGAGFSYEYHSLKDYIPKRTITVFGGKVFGRYFLFEDIFAHAEFEKLFYRDNYINPINDPLISMVNIYVGGGYRRWINNRSFVTIALLFNVLDDQYVFGINPILRFGVSFGL